MYRRAAFLTLCLVLSFSSGCASKHGLKPPPPAAESLNQTWTLAVLHFETIGKTNYKGEAIRDLLSSSLSGLDGFRVVERKDLKAILDQLAFEYSDLAKSENRTKVGGMLGAKLLCVGSLNKKARLMAARVIFTETGDVILSATAEHKDERDNIEEIAQKLREGLKAPKITRFLNEYSAPATAAAAEEEKTVTVKGYGGIIDGDIGAAREMAIKDAYAQAVEQGLGVKITAETRVEKFQVVQRKILAESAGYVTSYQILNENPESKLGYEVTVLAKVSSQPLSDVEKLKLVVQYLLAAPRIGVLIQGDVNGAPMTESQMDQSQVQIGTYLQKAGFSIVDVKQIEALKEDKFGGALSEEDAAVLGGMLKADVMVRSSLSAGITTRIEEIGGQKLDFSNITATTTGVFKVLLAETGEIIYSFSEKDLSSGSNKGFGTTDEAALSGSIDGFIKAASEKLAWGLSSKLGGPISFQLVLRKATSTQAQQLLEIIKTWPEQLVLSASLVSYQKDLALYQIKTTAKSQVLIGKLEAIDPEELEAEDLIIEKGGKLGTIVVSLGTP